MTAPRKTALVAGATGVIGRSLLELLAASPEWDAIAVSRRRPDGDGDWRHVPVDLLDAADAKAKLGGLGEVTHVFFSTYVERPSWAELVAPNVAVLANLMDAVEPVAKDLKHVNLMHGTKWYGNHLGPFKTPARETDPGHMPPNFYYDQQAYIAERQRGRDWSWSTARPHGVCGAATGGPMNLVIILAVYATLSKALGLPLRHPGSEANARSLYNVTDSGLLARASVWMATDPAAANEPFNVTNGDVFRWQDMFEAFAGYFDMKTARPQKIDLVHMMADKGALWQSLVERHGLQPIPYDQLVRWDFGNYVFSQEYDIISSTTKARRLGFAEVQDSEEMFRGHFAELRRRRIIP